MMIMGRILLIYMLLASCTYSSSAGISPDLGLSDFAKLGNLVKSDLKKPDNVEKDNLVDVVDTDKKVFDVVDTDKEVFVAGDDVMTKNDFVSGGWHGRDVLPYEYDPMEECQIKKEDGGTSYLYCPAINKIGRSTYCCGNEDERFCCTAAEWKKEKDHLHEVDDLPTWGIVLIVLGGLLLAALIVWLVLCIFCKVTECLCFSLTRVLSCLLSCFCCCCKKDDTDEEKVVLVKETHIHPPAVYNTVITDDLYQNVTPRNQQQLRQNHQQRQNLYPALPSAPQYPPPYKE